jgi:hypothetical protein
MSTRSCIGFDGVSKKTALVGLDNASAHSSRSEPSTNSVVIPHRGRSSSRMRKHEPKSPREATTRSPVSRIAINDVKTAAIPEAVAYTASAPSIVRNRSSNIDTVGFPYREYM